MDSFTGLLNNSAIMLILCVIYDTFGLYSIKKESLKDSFTGILVGVISIIVMLNPWYIEPGVFFDTRWVLLSLSGLFFGLRPTLLAVIIAGTFRLLQGGPGGVVGTIVIIVTACVGVIWRYYYKKNSTALSWFELYLFGVLVQLAMLSCMILMPAQMRIPILQSVGPPVLIIYPVLTMIIGLILKRQEDRRTADEELTANRKALYRERGLLKGVINSIQDSIYFRDTDGKYLGCNQAFAALTGKSEQAIEGKTNSELFEKNTVDFLAAQDEAVLTSLQPITREDWYNTEKNGRVLLNIVKTPFQGLDGTLHGQVGIIRDITEQYISDNALRASEAKFSKAFQIAPLLMSISSVEDGRYHDVNDAFIQTTGYKREDVVGATSVEIGFIDSVSREEIKQELISKGHIRDMDLNLIKADGSELFCKYSGEFIEIDGNKRLLSIATDLTERKNLEKDLLQAQKMEAIGTLAGGIAHDFNNILAAILGYTEMALDECKPGTSLSNNLQKVFDSGQRAKGLVQQILAFSHQNTAEQILLQPASLIKEAIKMLRPSLPATIGITIDLSPETKTIVADPTHFSQIVMNLCTNAYHAMEKTGGELTVTSKNKILNSKTYVHLMVKDTGPGIPQNIQKRIYDPYFTTKETGKGTGLGLSIVHGLVTKYDGIISLDSKVGEGTTLHVYLPAADHQAAFPPEAEREIPVGNERILFVDDEEMVSHMSKTMLERLGYQVTVENDSSKALETFQKEPDQYDLVITDQTMPGLTGVELSKKLIQTRPDISIILCTGYSAIISESDAKRAGVKEFAHKPITRKQMAELIRSVLD